MKLKDKSAQERVPSRSATRGHDREGTKQNILDIASEEFALNGLSGARIDEIAARTRSSKRMIYYYFDDKESLYVAALENAYRLVREGESKLDTKDLPPIEALRRLVEFTFDHHQSHEEFIRMVMIENIHNGEYLDRSKVVRDLNSRAIDHIAEIYSRGVTEGVFRPGLDPLELHWQVSALCFFNVSNRATFTKIFDRDLGAEGNVETLRRNVIDMVLRFVTRNEKLT